MYLKSIKVSRPLCTSFLLKLTLQKIVYSSGGGGTGCDNRAECEEGHGGAGIKAFLAFFTSGMRAESSLFHFFRVGFRRKEGIEAIQSCLQVNWA